jgi:hypothetical protein
VGESERLGLIGRLTPPKSAEDPGTSRAASPSLGGYRGRHGLDAEGVGGAAQIVVERRQAKLGAHIRDAALGRGRRV